MTNVNMMITRDGVKILANRMFKSSPDYTAPSTFSVSTNTPDTTYTDSSLTTLVPISGTEVVDTCAATTGWTASGSNSVSLNTTTFKTDTGTDGALNIIKSDTSNVGVYISKTTSSVDGTSKTFIMWLYIKDSTALAKLKTSGNAVVIRFGSDSSNYYYKNYEVSSFTTGWNFISIAITSGFTGTTSSPSISALDYSYIYLECNNATDTFAAGDIIIDSLRVGSVDDYVKNSESVSFDETEGTVTVTNKLTVSEANGFLIDGVGLFNTDGTPLMAVKCKFPSNSKSNTDLFKIITKLKFRNINQT